MAKMSNSALQIMFPGICPSFICSLCKDKFFNWKVYKYQVMTVEVKCLRSEDYIFLVRMLTFAVLSSYLYCESRQRPQNLKTGLIC